MPTIAESVATRDTEATRKHLQHGLYLLLLVTIPFSIWLAMVNRSLISLLYERANFSAADTTLVANILLLMIPYVFLGRFRGLLELPFFAEQDTRTPVMSAMLSAILFVVTSFLLVRVAGVYGIPMGRSLGDALGACFLLHLLRRRTGKIGFGAVRDVSIRICGASLIMAVFIWVGNWLAVLIPLHAIAAKATALALPTALGSGALILSLFLLRVLDPALIKRARVAMERRTGHWLVLNRTPRSL